MASRSTELTRPESPSQAEAARVRVVSAGAGRLRLLFPLVLASVFFLIAIGHTPFRYAPGELLYFALLYLLLAACLDLLLRFARGCGRVALWLASLGVGFLVAAQVRLDAECLTGGLPFGATALVVGAAVAWVQAHGPRAKASMARLLGLYGIASVLCLWVVLGFARTESIRWHLLRHHRLFGLPSYRLLARSLPSVRGELWRSQRRLVEPWERSAGVVETRPDGGPGSPNIVVLLVDTLRADALAAWGADPGLMPATNAWSAGAVVLTDVQANASWTRASVASLFTGLLPEEHGAARFHDKLAGAWHTLPEVLHDSGYQTAAFVANWVQVGIGTGFGQGFDRFAELRSPDEVQAGVEQGDGSIREQYARAAEVQRAALEWLAGEERAAAAATGRPLFLYMHYLDPHSPYLAGGEVGTESDAHERKRGAYRQELRYLDRELGRFFDALAEALPGPTVVLLTSDHGEEFWEHGEWGHGHSLYRELIEVPAIVKLPNGEQHGELDARLELRDLFDLVLRLARPATPDLAAWAGERDRSVRYASQYLDRTANVRPDRKWTGIRLVQDDEHTLIWSAFGPSLELYPHSDPGQSLNRIDAEPEPARALRGSLDSSVRFWTDAPRVERTADDLEFLRALGYAGGTH